ncbi:MAG: anhydro-N-acetylmuramic acid kinase [Flavobacteriales bacterium]
MQVVLDQKHILGIMSGTSCDGLDLCLASFSKTTSGFNYNIQQHHFFPYSKTWIQKLKTARQQTGEQVKILESEFTDLQIDCIKQFEKLYPDNQIDIISTHGHTVFHQPALGFTFQMTFGNRIAQKTNKICVSNFRDQDVFLGGQGAPLVPIGDLHLFSDYEVCLNLGGFANVSFNACFQDTNKRLAFDVCPFNILLNTIIADLGLDYDNNGALASEGKIDESLLNELNQLAYYQKDAPKSLSVEDLDIYYKLLNKNSSSIKTKLCTFVEHFAEQIAQILEDKSTVLITGGGAYHQFFIHRLKAKTNCKIEIPKPELIEFKEALIFGFLGFLRLHNQPNVLSSVTGSKQDHSSGDVHYPAQNL